MFYWTDFIILRPKCKDNTEFFPVFIWTSSIKDSNLLVINQEAHNSIAINSQTRK